MAVSCVYCNVVMNFNEADLSNSRQRVCVGVHVLNTFLFSLCGGTFYCFKNEGYLLEVFKMRFF